MSSGQHADDTTLLLPTSDKGLVSLERLCTILEDAKTRRNSRKSEGPLQTTA
jgi:hypothetical protein